MIDWTALRHPYQHYEMNEKTMTVRLKSYLRNANGSGSQARQRAQILTKSPAGTYNLKHSVNGMRKKFHPSVISECGIHGKKWPE